MALQGKMILNGADYAPFNLYGVGVFMAFSGSGIYRNKSACGAIKGDGPLPPGKYWIVERGAGGFFSKKRQRFRIPGTSTDMAQRLVVMNGLLFIKTAGLLRMVFGLMVYIEDCSVCIRAHFQKVA